MCSYRQRCRCDTCRQKHRDRMRAYMRANYLPSEHETPCAGCGGDLDGFTLGCKTCSTRHSVRRHHGTLRPTPAPTTPWWGRRRAI